MDDASVSALRMLCDYILCDVDTMQENRKISPLLLPPLFSLCRVLSLSLSLIWFYLHLLFLYLQNLCK